MSKLSYVAGIAIAALTMGACGETDSEKGRASVDAPTVASSPGPMVSDTDPSAAPTSTASDEAPASAAAGAASPITPLVVTAAQVAAEQSAEMGICLKTGDAAQGVTPAMAACINTELQAQDARLNASYRAAMSRLDASGRSRLQTEERAWIRQRDSACEQQATGGTIDRIEIPSCLLDETIRRRLALDATAR